MVEKFGEFANQRLEVPNLALPYDENLPPKQLQFAEIARISIPVASEFRGPEVEARFWRTAVAATVSMPKTSVNEDNLLAAGENNVWGSWKALYVQTIAITVAVE